MRTVARIALIVVAMGPLGLIASDGSRGSKSSRPHGIERRVPLKTSKVVGSPEPPPPYRVEKAFPNLKIKQALSFEQEPGTNQFLVIQHLGGWAPPGKILRFEDKPDADRYDEVLDLGPKTIAYGLDFHPKYAENGYLFVGMNTENDGPHKTRVSRYTVDLKTRAIDPKSELVIIEWESNGHNGGDLAFDKNGLLFVSSGDGTSDSDTNNRGQDMTFLTSKILRIDVDHPAPGMNYSVPEDNPFSHIPGARKETWAIGMRNPWRLTYDKASDQLWCGVNGQDLWETADLIERGGNYGWSVTEGSHPFLASRKLGPAPLTQPTVEHHHSEARSLSGGTVYHGKKYPELDGAYIYGDWSTGKIWAVKMAGKTKVFHREIADTTLQITGFGLDSAGELIVIDHQTAFYRLIPGKAEDKVVSEKFPRKLSDSGLFSSVADLKMAPGLIPYAVNSPLWSDGAGKIRHMAVPGTEKVEFSEQNGWTFPDHSVLVKTFTLDLAGGDQKASKPVPIETRFMVKEQGEWVGYSYLWNDEKTDATLVAKEGVDKVFAVKGADGKAVAQTWHYPSRAECMVCHSRASNYVLGLTAPQMNREFRYPRATDNQIRTLEHIGLFSNKVSKPTSELPKLDDPSDTKIALEKRVRSYLHSNCSSCHMGAGGGNAAIELTGGSPLEKLGVGQTPQQGALGVKDPKIIAPGHPESSTMFLAMKRRGVGQMPPLGTNVVDEKAVAMLRDWIAKLPSTSPTKEDAGKTAANP
jgi:uncharacterized repeat protein (TIGR03806 family)